MFDLMERTINEKYYYKDWGFIEPSGKQILAKSTHDAHAKKYLLDNGLSIPKGSYAIVAKYLDATGNVRYYIDDEQIGFTVVAPVTFAQIKVIQKLSKKGGDVWYEIYDKKGNHILDDSKFKSFYESLKKLDLAPELAMSESSIDFPRKDLDDAVWNKDGNTYRIKPEVRAKIFTFIKRYEDIDLITAAEEIHIVGSIGSNQYTDDADIDVHIVPKSNKGWNEDTVVALRKWFDKHRDEYDGYVEKHPIEVYIQTNSLQDMISVGNYDLINDKWLNGPTIVDKDYDPYDDFSHVADEVKALVKNADVLFGELKRDVIDFNVIKTAMEDMSQEDKKNLLQKLRLKLDEIESDIELLYKERKGFVDVRKSMDPEKALKDIEHMKQWRDDNATFKFINRYKYLKTIGALNDVLKDGEVTPDEMDQIKSVMGMQ